MLVPITGFYAALLAMVCFYLSILVIGHRRRSSIGIGDNGDKQLQKLVRVQANFIEYVPITLILLVVAELNQTSGYVLHGAGTALLIGRLLHAYGLRSSDGATWQRIAGMLLTFASLLSLAIANLANLY